MLGGLMTDWITIQGTGTSPFVQERANWLDLATCGDVTFWLEVRAITNPSSGALALSYETSPSTDESLFDSMVSSITMALTSTPTITKVRLADNPQTPLARFVRWRVEGSAAGNWSVTFRIFMMANKGSTNGFDPASLQLSGWWRADYVGSPWAASASAGASSGRDLAELTSPPSSGPLQGGYSPPDFDGTSSILRSLIANNVFFAGSGSLFCLFYADVAPAGSGNDYADGSFFTDPANAETTFGFTTSGIVGCVLDNTVNYQRISVACGTGAYHLAQFKFDGTSLKARVDRGSWSSVACGPYTPTNPSPIQVGASYGVAVRFDGKMLELGTAAVALTDPDFDNLVSYVNGRYGLSL